MGRRPDQPENEVPLQNQGTVETAVVTPAANYQTSDQAAANAERTRKAFTDNENLARELKDGTISGFVGSGTNVHGEASFKGMMRVDGTLSGGVKSEKGTLIVSSGGTVEAKIEVAIANINGTVRGDIIATERIELGRSAVVIGNIQAPSLVIEQGAVFDGNCRMSQKAKSADVRQDSSVDRKKEGSRDAQNGKSNGIDHSAIVAAVAQDAKDGRTGQNQART
jgi:cytoskeletal protein CcmA (bactofilin family)